MNLVSKNAHLEFEIMRMESSVKELAKKLNVEHGIEEKKDA